MTGGGSRSTFQEILKRRHHAPAHSSPRRSRTRMCCRKRGRGFPGPDSPSPPSLDKRRDAFGRFRRPFATLEGGVESAYHPNRWLGPGTGANFRGARSGKQARATGRGGGRVDKGTKKIYHSVLLAGLIHWAYASPLPSRLNSGDLWGGVPAGLDTPTSLGEGKVPSASKSPAKGKPM